MYMLEQYVQRAFSIRDCLAIFITKRQRHGNCASYNLQLFKHKELFWPNILIAIELPTKECY